MFHCEKICIQILIQNLIYINLAIMELRIYYKKFLEPNFKIRNFIYRYIIRIQLFDNLKLILLLLKGT